MALARGYAMARHGLALFKDCFLIRSAFSGELRCLLTTFVVTCHLLSISLSVNALNNFFSETPGLFFFKFHVEPSVNWEFKICSNG